MISQTSLQAKPFNATCINFLFNFLLVNSSFVAMSCVLTNFFPRRYHTVASVEVVQCVTITPFIKALIRGHRSLRGGLHAAWLAIEYASLIGWLTGVIPISTLQTTDMPKPNLQPLKSAVRSAWLWQLLKSTCLILILRLKQRPGLSVNFVDHPEDH
jgi:hypothetical protein